MESFLGNISHQNIIIEDWLVAILVDWLPFPLQSEKKTKKKQIVKTYITISNDPIQFTQFSLSDPGLINLHHDVVYSSKHHHAEPLLAVTSISALQLRRLNVKDRPMARS